MMHFGGERSWNDRSFGWVRETPFCFPLGLEMIEGENYRQRQGYDVTYMKDDESPRYQFTAAVGADKAPRVFTALAGLLPELVKCVLEIPARADDGREICEVWVSRLLPRDEFLRAFRSHRKLFVHDGMVGFGAVSADGLTEVFLDEHKLIYVYTRELDMAETLLSSLEVPALEMVRHFSELGHIHSSLSSKGAGELYWEVARRLKRSLDLELEETKEYT